MLSLMDVVLYILLLSNVVLNWTRVRKIVNYLLIYSVINSTHLCLAPVDILTAL